MRRSLFWMTFALAVVVVAGCQEAPGAGTKQAAAPDQAQMPQGNAGAAGALPAFPSPSPAATPAPSAGGQASASATGAGSTSQPAQSVQPQPAPTPAPKPPNPVPTPKQYNDVSTGMTYEQVKKAIGNAGKMSSESSDEDGNASQTYEFKLADGGNMMVTFRNGKVLGKSTHN